MKSWRRKGVAFFLSLLLTISVTYHEGNTVLEGVYFSAANDQLLDLNADTMPFYSGGQLYIPNTFFEKTDLGVRYVRNNSMGLAMLYTTRQDLRFDLINRTVSDKNGIPYRGSAIEKNGYVFFPVALVCQYFGLRWSLTKTSTVPLLRIKSSSVILDDRTFIDAASNMMTSRYAAYEKYVESMNPPVEDPPSPPPIQAADGQKIHLILRSKSTESTQKTIELAGDDCKITFLMTVQQFENGDLLRTILGRGHEIALIIQSTTEDEIRSELMYAREVLWNASSNMLHLVWHDEGTDISSLLADMGCVAVTAKLDRSSTPVYSQKRSSALLTIISRYREDISVYLGYDSDCLNGLNFLFTDLLTAKYRLCAWRLTTKIT